MDSKDDVDLKHVELVDAHRRARQQHYKPITDEERALDRRVNFKLDVTVVLVLATSFIVSLGAMSLTSKLTKVAMRN